VIDLGCGTGEHSRFLAGEGFQALGLDRSETMLAKAQEKTLPPNLQFVLGEIQSLGKVVKGRFGAAISLGNVLVHLTELQELERAFASLAHVLESGGIFLFQILNYERLFEKNIRHLPLNFRREEDGEIIFVRLMEFLEESRIRFCPTTLKYNPKVDPPVQVVRTRMTEIRGWRQADLLPLLQSAGFRILSIYGDMKGGPFEPGNSHDLVVVAQRAADNK
jgi:SAM-dependent methyltransferase